MKSKNDELNYLLEIARKLGFRVFIDKILSPGGACRVYQNRYIVINKTLTPAIKVKVLKEILVNYIDEDTYLEPKVRKLLGLE